MKWIPTKMPMDVLKPAKYNPRRMTTKQREDLRTSLSTFGLADPLICNCDGTIIGGHQRYALLKEQDVAEVNCMIPEVDLNENQEKELNLRLNKNQGEFDLGLLTAFDPAMLVTAGFDGDMVDTLFELDSKEDDYDVQKQYETITTPRTVLGDIYVFEGSHRLMCGSSTDEADVARLMDGHKADLVFTDPPYNVAYKGKSGIKNDDQSEEDFCAFLGDAFTNAFIHSKDSVNVYVWFAMSNYSQFRSSIEGAGFRYMQVVQ